MLARVLFILMVLTSAANSFAQEEIQQTYSREDAIVEAKKTTGLDNEQTLIVETKIPEDFQLIVELRKQLVSEIAELGRQIEFLSGQISFLGELENEKNIILQRKIQDDALVKRLRAIENRTAEQEEELKRYESYIQQDELRLETIRQDKARLNNLENEFALNNKILQVRKSDLERVNLRISNMLNIEEERNNFRTMISIAFCVLVAIVIIGFYFIAFKKEEIAESIFAGEKGIQFVTIFLIVIAIILFGIMGILEGKELSALLGGLSGYILGRVSTSSKEEKRQSAQ